MASSLKALIHSLLTRLTRVDCSSVMKSAQTVKPGPVARISWARLPNYSCEKLEWELPFPYRKPRGKNNRGKEGMCALHLVAFLLHGLPYSLTVAETSEQARALLPQSSSYCSPTPPRPRHPFFISISPACSGFQPLF